LVGVLGTYFLYSKTINIGVIPPAFLIGSLSVAVLNLNNMRDIETDELANKITIPVRIGLEKAKIYHFILVSLACLSVIYLIFDTEGWFRFVALVPLALLIRHLIFVKNCDTPALFDPELKKVALSTFLISFIFFINEFLILMNKVVY
jgi:1,4-dihydroxy-2-naphthoate octaprenyltransferase